MQPSILAAAAAACALAFSAPALAYDPTVIHFEGVIDQLSSCPNLSPNESCTGNPVPNLGSLSVGQHYASDISIDLTQGSGTFSLELTSLGTTTVFSGTGSREFFPLVQPDGSFLLMANLYDASGARPSSLITFSYVLQFAEGTFSNPNPGGAQLAVAIADHKLLGARGGAALFGCSDTPTAQPCGYVGLAFDKVTVSAVPEPASFVLCGLGLLATAGIHRRRQVAARS